MHKLLCAHDRLRLGEVVGQLQAALPYVERLSALLMVVAGSYIVYYWLFKGNLIDSFT